MSQNIVCPQCQKQYQVPDDCTGKKVRCKACGNTWIVPAAAAAPAASPSPVAPLNDLWNDFSPAQSAPLPAAPLDGPAAKPASAPRKLKRKSSAWPIVRSQRAQKCHHPVGHRHRNALCRSARISFGRDWEVRDEKDNCGGSRRPRTGRQHPYRIDELSPPSQNPR